MRVFRVSLIFAAGVLAVSGVSFGTADLSVWPKEEVDVTEEGGVPLKVCREHLPVFPQPAVVGHTREDLPAPENCGFDAWGNEYCCSWSK